MQTMQGPVSVLSRILLSTIFILSALGKKIPDFNAVAAYMASEGVPAAPVMLVGAIVFLLAGGISVILGFKARIGATLLLIFLVLATYFFHDFWTMTGADREAQTIQFMKNLSLMGGMLFIIANGSGKWSLDNQLPRVKMGVEPQR